MIVSIILNAILIPVYGLTGAAIATASSIGIYNIIKMIYVWAKFGMQPFAWKTLGVIALGISVLYISTFLPQLSNIYFDVIIRSLLMAVLYMGSVWVFNLSEEINSVIKGVVKRIKKLM